MKNLDTHARKPNIRISLRSGYDLMRLSGFYIAAGMMVIGCEGGSVTSVGVPTISSSVPALTDDQQGPVTESLSAADETLLADSTMILDDGSLAEPDLPEAPVQPAEGTLDDGILTLDDAMLVDDAESTTIVQTLQVDTVSVPASNVGLSSQAQVLLSGALSRGGVRIMPTGDSITHGIGGSGSYRSELADVLDTAGCSYRMVGSQSQSLKDTGYYGAHEGYSGHTADDFLNGQQTSSGNNPGIANAVNYQSPDLVLLHIGSVDLFKGQTVESTISDIAAVIDTIHQNKPDTVVVVANVIPWFNDTRDSNLPNSIRMLGNKIQELVQSSNNPLVSLADVRSGFTEEMMQSDLIHPNMDGDTHIANAMFDSFYSSSVCK